ncbi:hypothetical protein KY290_035493 [Solanum tuberosum]|uniref:Uncharacterized protein n=1 Tax=Solanum tuberosum TaxID=4113 RepID=A0ABQ7U6B3_SOLTU|nr:hypothetical protein KY289_034526 [Solanum tuberosum]KAH0646326.1 hypothetical protein KY284_034210 [Solanum tuberosum]KAH0649038.1 hypothetical protein KY285_034286 [Solanum tuberosum]KAH0742450.1 hypothetical protein KY290_035493 [Solanum tuberosum]
MPSSESSGITVDDLTIGEVESSTAIVFTNRRMQQQQQQPLPFGSEFSIFQPEVINPRQNHLRNMPNGILHAPRPIINQPSQVNFVQSQNLSAEAQAYYPHGQRPRLSYGSSSRAEEIAQGGTNLGTQPNQGSPQIPRPITNNLYDPSYAARGLPMDPHLRAILTNPGFFVIPKPNQSKR